MGVVYQARDQLLDETVAIKVLRPDAASADVAQRFRAEIMLARKVSHKNVCRIHEYGEDRGIRYISMAYVEGVDIKQLLRERGPLPADEAFEIAIRVAEGLQAIHDEGIIHRDLKTPNIMLDGRGVVRLMDFGIAKLHDSDGQSMTITGQIIGTPEYMSPEQVQAQRLDPRSDVYSHGVVTYELFTGATPFRADTPLGIALKQISEPPPLQGDAATRLPAALLPVLRTALAKKRDDRYASAREMARALEEARALATGPTHRLEPTIEAPARPGESLAPTAVAPGPARRRMAWTLVAGALAAGAAWLVFRPESRSGSAALVALLPTQPPALPSPTLASPPAATATPPQAAAPTPAPTAAVRRATARPEPSPPVRVDARVDAGVDRLLAEADKALEAENFDVAIARYDDVLDLDTRNAAARLGRTAAISAKVTRPPAPAAQRSFTAGRTRAESAETRPDTAFASGFEENPGVAVTRDTQAATLPGRIEFKTEPEAVRPGERFRLEVRLANAGNAPIEIAELFITTKVNGRNVGGAVAPRASTVAPGQTAPLLSLSDALREDLKTWSLEVQLRTTRGETYRNQLVWADPDAPAAAR